MRNYTWQLGDRVANNHQEGVIIGFSDLHPIVRTSPTAVTTASQKVLERSFGWRLIALAGKGDND